MSLRGTIYKLIMNSAGKNSKGIQIAKKCGLNSAEMMEYIYRRMPTPVGKSFLGTWADSIFLKFPTWNYLRQRKQNLQNILYHILKGRLEREPENEIKVLDLASGYSQYIFAILDKLGDSASKIYIEMRDKNVGCEEYINNANKNRYNIKYVKADILKEEDYDLSNTFDIIILAGFFDSLGMGEVNKIEHTMNLVKKIMNINALFIFSYQASHVDYALVNELFNDTYGVPLSMGERQKVDIQFMMKETGFNRIGQIEDADGCYPIVVAAQTDTVIDYIDKVLSVSKNNKS